MLRGIDRFLDLGELQKDLPPHHSHTGRPSIDPALLIRMLVVGYCSGIRSKRRLCEEVHLSLAYRWFCRLGLEDAADEYRCPQGKPLLSTGKPTSDNTLIRRSSVHDCTGCELEYRCCPNTTHRKIGRQLNESARDLARQLATTKRYAQSRRHRRKVELLFAHLERISRLDRLRLRGLKGARDEYFLAATARISRRMAAWMMPKSPEAANAAPTDDGALARPISNPRQRKNQRPDRSARWRPAPASEFSSGIDPKRTSQSGLPMSVRREGRSRSTSSAMGIVGQTTHTGSPP